MKNPKPGSKSLSKQKRITFSLVSVLLPFIFLLLIELLLRVAGYGDNLSLFVDHPDAAFKGYKVVNPDIGKKYFYKVEYSSPAKDIFLKEKPDDVFRVFVMGSSTVVGFPYENNLMFSRILQERLRDAYPDKKIEMVNTAITAINSFTLVDFMPQILQEKPDAILIYAGHNEFYGAFGAGSNEAIFHSPALIRIHLSLINYRIYQLVVNVVNKVTGIFSFADETLKKRGTLMTRMVRNADILYGSDTYREGIRNYEQNLEKMLSMARERGVEVFISDLVGNLKDLKPFKSISSEEMKGADDYYQLAKDFEKKGEWGKAEENYKLARDYDCIRFRASSDINRVANTLANKYSAHFVPTLDLFRANSPNGIVGDHLLTEHVHPNIAGQFLLAEAFYQEMVRSKLIAAQVNEITVKSLNQFRKDYGVSELDYLIGKHRINNLKYHWPFRDETKDYVDYREIYRPSGIIDSLAFNVMAKHQITLAEAHEYLAERYKKQGDFFRAFQEYNALTKILPYWSPNFRAAGDCLLKMNDLSRALVFYERSTENGQGVFYAHFRAGEICLIKNDLEAALRHFQKSQETATVEEKQKALYKIYQTLTYLNRSEEGKDIVDYFKKINPNQLLQIPPRVGSFLDYIPLQVKNFVDLAREADQQKNFAKAIETLGEALTVKETSVVFRLLGYFYLKTGDYQKSVGCLMKAYSDFQFDAAFLHQLIVANRLSGNADEAKKQLDKLKHTNPAYIYTSQLDAFVNAPHAVASTVEINLKY